MLPIEHAIEITQRYLNTLKQVEKDINLNLLDSVTIRDIEQEITPLTMDINVTNEAINRRPTNN